jgi:hypothetical protein
MSARAARGQKRKCQNEECGVSFYDLKRDLFHCPTCDTLFDHEAEAELRAEKTRHRAGSYPPEANAGSPNSRHSRIDR